jgi:hypothetical protein
MEEENDVGPILGKLLTIVGYALGIAVSINLFVSLELFFKVVFPDFGKGTLWHYVRLVIILVIFGSVRETFIRNRNLKLFLCFNLFLLLVNIFTVYRNWYAH